MTKEHAWPQWLGRGILVDPHRHTYISGFHRTGDLTFTEKPNEVVHQNGSVLTQVVREVCAECNNGWMSRLEMRARPLLERMWAPTYPFGSMTLTGEEVDVVAAWATKTVWVNERHATRANTADAAVRLRFSRELHQAPHTTVWVARHAGKQDFHALSASIDVSHNQQHWESGETRHVHMCTLRFRSLCFIVRTDSGPGVPPMNLPADGWTELARQANPPQDGVAKQVGILSSALMWPPSRQDTDEEVDWTTRNVSAWLTMPPTTRFVRSGDWEHRRHN